jgi:hypothetical protein
MSVEALVLYQEQEQTWHESSLKNPQQKAASDQSTKAFGDTLTNRDDS